MLMDKSKLNQIFPCIGDDSLKKLQFILKKTYPNLENYDIKSGDFLNLTLSYCIEIAYNEVFYSSRKLKSDNSPLPLTPPTTSKSQMLYGIFQLITSLRASGLTNFQILKYLNNNKIPTPDDLMKTHSLDLIKQYPSPWRIDDLTIYLTEKGTAGVLLQEYIGELNCRAQK